MNLIHSLLAVFALGIVSAGCAAGGLEGPVAELSDAQLGELCGDFHDAACPTSTDDFCAPTCRATCTAPATAALMKQECPSPITVSQVDRCAELFGAEDPTAFDVCVMGGGCVFDVFDETCP